MPSVSRALVALGLVVAAVGVVAGGYGVYEWQTDTCESGYGLSVERVATNETPRSSLDRVAYENLSAAEQRVFREALAGEHDNTGVVENQSIVRGLGAKLVSYRGDRYETVVWVSDCTNSYAALVVYGGLAAAVGAVVAGGAFGWRRLTRR